MAFETTPINPRAFSRQTSEPSNVIDGFLWVNPAAGANGGNNERYYWNESDAVWELDSAVGPDTPSYAVSGSIWRDTSVSAAKQYDGVAWQNMGVTDHSNLTNVTASQHHAAPTGGITVGGFAEAWRDGDDTTSVGVKNTTTQFGTNLHLDYDDNGWVGVRIRWNGGTSAQDYELRIGYDHGRKEVLHTAGDGTFDMYFNTYGMKVDYIELYHNDAGYSASANMIEVSPVVLGPGW